MRSPRRSSYRTGAALAATLRHSLAQECSEVGVVGLVIPLGVGEGGEPLRRVDPLTGEQLLIDGRGSEERGLLDVHWLDALDRHRAAERTRQLAAPGAERWLKAAAAAGTTKLCRKLAEATALAKLHGPEAVDEALIIAADAGRFGDGDLATILAHYQGAQVIAFPAKASEERSLQRSTADWEGFGA